MRMCVMCVEGKGDGGGGQHKLAGFCRPGTRICESAKEVAVHSRGWGKRMDHREPGVRLLLSQTSSQTK